MGKVLVIVTGLSPKGQQADTSHLFLFDPHLGSSARVREKWDVSLLFSVILLFSTVFYILHEPVTLLKQRGQDGVSDLYLEALQNLFKLSEHSVEAVTEESKPQDAS